MVGRSVTVFLTNFSSFTSVTWDISMVKPGYQYRAVLCCKTSLRQALVMLTGRTDVYPRKQGATAMRAYLVSLQWYCLLAGGFLLVFLGLSALWTRSYCSSANTKLGGWVLETFFRMLMFHVDTVLLPLPSFRLCPPYGRSFPRVPREAECRCADLRLLCSFQTDRRYNCGDPLYSTKKFFHRPYRVLACHINEFILGMVQEAGG